MRNIFKHFILAIGLLSITACSDFLDQTSASDVESEATYNSTYYTRLRLNSLYGQLTQDQTYSQYIPIIWGLNSDCELVDGFDANSENTSSERGNMNYNANPGWGNIAKLWDAMYAIVEDANLIIAGVSESETFNSETTSSNQKLLARYRHEAMTMRAMIYLDLIRFFGDIPMAMEPTTTSLSNAYQEKTDRDVILDYLIADLEEVTEQGYLPWAGESSYTTEYINMGYAHALLAQIALTRAGYSIRESAKDGYVTASYSDATYPTQRCSDEKRREMYQLAKTHLSAVIGSSHDLNPSFENQWYLLNQLKLDETYRENIFEIPMGLGRSGELGYTVGVRVNGSTNEYGTKGNSSGKMTLTAPYLYSFNQYDTRRDVTCAIYQIKKDATSSNTTYGLTIEDMLGNKPFGVYCAKWDVRKMTEEWRAIAIAAGNAKWTSGINVVRMRYSQVLLMYAEVLNELNNGPTTEAKAALKAVRERAYAEGYKDVATTAIDALSTKEEFFDAIVDENAWELAGEGVRKFELIRWGILSERIDAFKQQYKDDYTSGKYPAKIYYQTTDNGTKIDMSSIQWYAVPGSTSGYSSKNFFGREADYEGNLTTLEYISAGLNKSVLNRHLMPIASTTISTSNGRLHNSYGFSD